MAQFEKADEITQKRLNIWNIYHEFLAELEQRGDLRRPIIPAECQHNAHMYYILLNSFEQRTELIKKFKKHDIHPVFHYIPLHSAPAGKQFARAHGELKQTDQLSERLLRLPLWVGLGNQQKDVLRVLGAKAAPNILEHQYT